MSHLTDLREQRDALAESINAGVSSASVGGQSTSFASLAERQQVLSRINREIARLEGAAQSRPVASTINLGGF